MVRYERTGGWRDKGSGGGNQTRLILNWRSCFLASNVRRGYWNSVDQRKEAVELLLNL